MSFIALGPGLIRVTVEHRGWEHLTDEQLTEDCAAPGGYRFGAYSTGWHAAYWTDLYEQGRAVMFGVVLDRAGAWGLAVVEATDEDEVRAIASDDPAVKTGLCTFEVGVMPQATVRPRQAAA